MIQWACSTCGWIFMDTMPRKVFSIHQDISPSCAALRNPRTDFKYTAEHNVWLNALIDNDVDSVGSLLAQADERGKHLLLEGWICDETFWACWSGGNNRFHKTALIQRPLSLAAVNGSYGAIGLLYRSGIAMLQSDASEITLYMHWLHTRAYYLLKKSYI